MSYIQMSKINIVFRLISKVTIVNLWSFRIASNLTWATSHKRRNLRNLYFLGFCVFILKKKALSLLPLKVSIVSDSICWKYYHLIPPLVKIIREWSHFSIWTLDDVDHVLYTVNVSVISAFWNCFISFSFCY